MVKSECERNIMSGPIPKHSQIAMRCKEVEDACAQELDADEISRWYLEDVDFLYVENYELHSILKEIANLASNGDIVAIQQLLGEAGLL